MYWFKPKINVPLLGIHLLINIFLIDRSYALFRGNDCLNSKFSISIKHKGKPFGLVDHVLVIDKKKCVMDIKHEKFKIVKNAWTVDVCRAPIHIKKGITSIEVFKKPSSCIAENQNHSYCQEWKELDEIIQDDGLIFAEGEKERLNSPHGKTYCSYLLIKKYLKEGVIFNLDENFEFSSNRSSASMIIDSASEEISIPVNQLISTPQDQLKPVANPSSVPAQ